LKSISKRTYIVILLIILFGLQIGWFISRDSETIYKDGIYTNQAYGYHSDILIEVVVEGGKISEINILSHEEPKILADIVFEKLPRKMIRKNSYKVDIISGATYTSKSLIEAVGKALEDAVISN
jgi:uncharacterized protein with FMN-binding domain